MLTSQQTKSKYRKAANNFINTNHDNTNESNKYISLHNSKKNIYQYKFQNGTGNNNDTSNQITKSPAQLPPRDRQPATGETARVGGELGLTEHD